MSETSQIAEIARTVSKDLFSIFGWQTIGPKDHDFGCALSDRHENQTHPSDVVFFYDDPYVDRKIFLNTDLKSWKAATFSKARVRGELIRLCKSVECANVSPDWARSYGDSSSQYQVHGLLFLFNHDNAFSGSVARYLQDCEMSDFPLPLNRRVFVFTPDTINYLVAVANDIVNACGRNLLPGIGAVRYYYPDLVDVHPRSNERTVATAEVLSAPWQVLRYTIPPSTSSSRSGVGYFVYYRGKGASEDEFKYLIDYFFRYSLLTDDSTISIRMPFAEPHAAATFAQAKDRYADEFYGLTEFRQRLDRISFERIPQITLALRPTDEAMNNG